MSSIAQTKAALAAATALAGGTVSTPTDNDAAPVSVDTTLNTATPIANTTQSNAAPATASKMALALYSAGMDRSVEGSDAVFAGRGMISAAIVCYCTQSLKMKPVDATDIGKSDDKTKAFHADMVRVFYGARPPTTAPAKASLAAKHAAQAIYSEFVRRQFHITNAADLALCLIADGVTLSSWDKDADLWSLAAPLFCEDGVKPSIDAAKRYTMVRARAGTDAIPCVTTTTPTEPTTMQRDASHYVRTASARHSILKAAEYRAQRAPHRNAPASNKSGSSAHTTTTNKSAPNASGTAPVVSTPTSAPTVNGGNATTPTITLPDTTPLVGNTVTPLTTVANAGLDMTVQATRRNILATCGAPNFRDLDTATLTAKVSKATLTDDGWRAWQDLVNVAIRWHVALGGTLPANVEPTPTPINAAPVQTATVVDGVTLSSPTKAVKSKSKSKSNANAADVAA